jgi:excisionase family DNA binding protein
MTRETCTLAEAAQMLGLNRKTLVRLADAGEIPAPLHLSARKYLWSRRALAEFLARGRTRRFVG